LVSVFVVVLSPSCKLRLKATEDVPAILVNAAATMTLPTDPDELLDQSFVSKLGPALSDSMPSVSTPADKRSYFLHRINGLLADEEGKTAAAIGAKSQRSQNITQTMRTTVSVSMTILRVSGEAKVWIVETSEVMVLRIMPTCRLP
jgi:hypothetical protein